MNPIVKIEYSGDYAIGFERANYEAGLNQKTTPNGYVWHRLDDCDAETNKGTMQLAEKPLHRGINHNGGVRQYKAATGKEYVHPGRFRSKKICSVL
ncbi:HNH endonuclease [Cronobacter dublinensis]